MSEEAQVVQTYLNYMKLPNIHVGIYYPAQTDEFGTPTNCNGMIGEDKHRFFKLIIYLINHRRPEKDLTKENIRIIRKLRGLLPPSEQMSVEAREDIDEENDEWVLQAPPSHGYRMYSGKILS